MKKLLRVVLWFLPVTLFAQSPFDGTWKTNMATAKLSQKPYEFSVNNGMYDCESCVPKINIKADAQDQAVSGQTYDTLAVKVTDPNTIQLKLPAQGFEDGAAIRCRPIGRAKLSLTARCSYRNNGLGNYKEVKTSHA